MKVCKMIKKLSVFILAIAVSAGLCLNASDMTSIGYGDTPEKARYDALKQLAEYISVKMESETELGTADDGVVSSSYYTERITAESKGIFSGVEYGKAERMDDGWSVKASISESRTSYYVEMAAGLYEDISDIDMKREGDAAQLLSYYVGKLDAYEKWNQAVAILNKLTDGEYQSGKPSVSLLTVRQRYMDVLTSEHSNLLMLEHELKRKLKYSELTAEDNMRLSQSASSILEIEEEMMRNMEREKMQQQAMLAKLDEQQQAYFDTLQTRRKNDRVQASEDILELYRKPFEIEDLRYSFSYFRNSLKAGMEDIYTLYENGLASLSDEIYGAPYLKIELDENGVPKISAMEKRVDRFTESAYAMYFEFYDTAQKLYDDGIRNLMEIRKEAQSLIASLPKVKVSSVTGGGLISARIENFDLDSGVWSGSISLPVGSEIVAVPFSFSYQDWTGKRIPVSSSSAWNGYLAEAEYWNDIFINMPESFNVRITSHVEGTLENNIYRIVIDTITVTKALDDAHVRTEDSNSSVLITIGSENSNMNDLAVENRFGIEKIRAEHNPTGDSYREPPLPEIPDRKLVHKEEYPETVTPNKVFEYVDRTVLDRESNIQVSLGVQMEPGMCYVSCGAGWVDDGFIFGSTVWSLGGKIVFGFDPYNELSLFEISNVPDHGSFEESMTYGGLLDLEFRSYLDSYAFFNWGLETGAGYSSDGICFDLGAVCGLGTDFKIDSMDFSAGLSLYCGLDLLCTATPEPRFRYGVDTVFSMMF